MAAAKLLSLRPVTNHPCKWRKKVVEILHGMVSAGYNLLPAAVIGAGGILYLVIMLALAGQRR